MTYQAFPLTPAPSHYTDCETSQRSGVYYQGEHISFVISKRGATTCTVRDYTGTVVSTTPIPAANFGSWGSAHVTNQIIVTPRPPTGGWPCGYYRAYLTGPNTDSLFGDAYGSINFGVIPGDPNFPRLPQSIPDTGTYGGGWVPPGQGEAGLGGPAEHITRACLGIPGPRLSTLNQGAGNGGFDRLVDVEAEMVVVNNYWLNPAYLDPVRPRTEWMDFPDDSCDVLTVPPIYMQFAVLDPSLDGSNVFVSTGNGTGTGGSDIIKVYYPNAVTLVETYDNITSQDVALAAINGTSAYVYAWYFANVAHPNTTSPTAIGDSIHQGVVNCVSTLYPLGVTHFEGPYNEPNLDDPNGPAVIAHRAKLLNAYVHEGNASAKTMSPATVDITNSRWPAYLAALTFTPDAISFHDYNTSVNGDLNQGRAQIERFVGWVSDAGFSAAELWQTEATHNLSAVFGTHHPRRARVTMMRLLLWEQYGMPFERNSYWYDYSHGFWSYPAWLFNDFNGDKSLNPQALTWATLARETYGKDFHHRIDFGSVSANRIFVGNVYGDATTGSVAVLMAASYMDSSTVTLTITGTGSAVSVSDSFGNVDSVAQSSGRITVDVLDTPTYVRLPVGVNASVYSVRDWEPAPSPSVSMMRSEATLGGVPRPEIANEEFMETYSEETTIGIAFSTITPPDEAIVKFFQSISVERVIVWCGPFWQEMSGLYGYTVDTWDGANWTTRATVARSPGPSFLHGSDVKGMGCQMETFDREQWIEDIKLPSPVTCEGIRLSVTDISYGGEPDSDRVVYGGFQIGQGDPAPVVAIQEISVVSPTTLTLPGSYVSEVLADSPNLFWMLNDTSGTTAVSEVNSPALDGTYVASPVLGVPGAIPGETAVNFKDGGANSRVEIAHDAAMDVGDTFTYECWYKPTPGWGQLMFQFSTSLWVNDGYVTLSLQAVGDVVIATSRLSVGIWYHIAVAKDGASSCKMYLNGLDVSGTVTNRTFTTDISTMYVGAANGTLSCLGHMQAAAVYPTALSEARIQAHYQSGAAPAIPSNTKPPFVEGTATQGTQVGCVSGTWLYNATSFAYQWQDSANGTTGWADIAGETLPDYIIGSGENTKYLRCGVIATNPAGDSSVVYSNVIGPVT